MDDTVVTAQLLALRAGIGSLQAQIDALACSLAQPSPSSGDAPPPCDHAERDFVGALGDPRWVCRRCQQEFHEAGEAAT